MKIQLFRTFCYNLFCAQLWCNLPDSKLNAVKVAYNNIFRNFGIKMLCSISEMYLNNLVDSFPVLIRNSTVNFRSAQILIKHKYTDTYCNEIFGFFTVKVACTMHELSVYLGPT